MASQRRAVGDQRGERASAGGLAVPPTIRKINPADTPILVLGLTSTACRYHGRRLRRKHLAAKISQIPASALSAWAASRTAPSVYRSIRRAGRSRHQPRRCAHVLGDGDVDLPEGYARVAGARPTRSQTNDQLLTGRTIRRTDHRLSARIAVRYAMSAAPSARQRRSGRGWFNQQRAYLPPCSASRSANVIETVDRDEGDACRMLDRPRSCRHQGNIISTAPRRSALRRRRAVHLTLDDRAGGDGDLPVPAQFLGDGHSGVTVPLSLIGTFAVL